MKRMTITIYVPEDVHKAVAEDTKKRFESINKYVSRLIIKDVEKQGGVKR